MRDGRLISDRKTGCTVVIGKGDQVILTRNLYDAHQPNAGRAVLRNGIRGHVIQVTCNGIRVQLDPEHIGEDAPLSSGSTGTTPPLTSR